MLCKILIIGGIRKSSCTLDGELDRYKMNHDKFYKINRNCKYLNSRNTHMPKFSAQSSNSKLIRSWYSFNIKNVKI